MTEETFGPYRIEELLGRGGMGEVHRAYDTAHDRFVALKRLSPGYHDDEDYRARFRREAQIVARLREPHVIPIHAYGEIDDRLYLDMRLVEGADLSDLIRTEPLEPSRAVRIVEQVASALDAAHTDGLIHRDVKPSNILVTSGDFVYLVDFGIARSASPAATALTASGSVVGTLDYMAPERFESGPVDGRADVYALACVLFACLSGRRPFTADGTAAQIWAHLNEAPPKASAVNAAVPVGLDDVIARGMAKKPADRYATAGEFARAAALVVAPPATPPGGHAIPGTPAAGLPGLAAAAGGLPGLATPLGGQPGLATPAGGQPGLATPAGGQPGLATPAGGQPGLVPPVAGKQGSATPAGGQPGLAAPPGGQPGLAGGQPGFGPGASAGGMAAPGTPPAGHPRPATPPGGQPVSSPGQPSMASPPGGVPQPMARPATGAPATTSGPPTGPPQAVSGPFPRPTNPGPANPRPTTPGPQQWTSPPFQPGHPQPGADRTTKKHLALAGSALAVVAAIVATILIVSDNDKTLGSGTSTSSTPTSTSSSTPTTTTTTTTTTKARSPQDDALEAALPAIFKSSNSCLTMTPDAGPVAAIRCGTANAPVDSRFPPPTEAEFRLFADRAAQDAYFLGVVQSRGIPRMDDRGGCRPDVDPIHYALYYRDTSGPLPGEFTTCFLSEGNAEVWWVDSKTLTIGRLKRPGDLTVLGKLDLWWNSNILSAS
ncbi:protein kinase domain-containing protein [Lentzea sp. CA-135723]|uniref:serine/threonine-protein kinase n=1 Tax=Lentzea sp. CA-135723 TaxID=3239950 RepID=UPI003D8FC00B